MPSAYVVCATPRTGSTLLCDLLSSTRVLGRPESYFRGPDEAAWAARLDVPIEGSRVRDYREFVQAVRTAGTTANGVFAARMMWGSLERIVEGLGESPGQSDLDTLERAFGPLHFVHLQREDVIAQAVSWFRAEQTGVWQPGDVAEQAPVEDLNQMKDLVMTIREHDLAWQSWFDSRGVRPHHVTYEQLVGDRRGTIEGIAARLQVEIPHAWQPASSHERQADEINHLWATALRAALSR